MRRLTVLVAISTVLVALAATPARAEVPSATAGTVTFTKTVTAKLPTSVRGMQMRNLATNEIRPLDTPPAGGCDWSSPAVFHLTVNWHYVNGALTNTESDGFAGIQCFTSGSGQSMAALESKGQIWINTTHRSDGNQGACPNCNFVASNVTRYLRWAGELRWQLLAELD
jgi:hypothetical protein